MKRIQYIFLTLCLMLVSFTSVAQTSNRLVISNTGLAAGSKAVISIALENTSEITALQFNVAIPHNLGTLSDVTFTDRASKHEIKWEPIYNDYYRVLGYDLNNKSFSGNSGALINLTVDVSDHVNLGETYNIDINDIVLSDKNGDNLATETYVSQSLTIVDAQNLIISEVKVDRDNLNPEEEFTLSWIVKNDGSKTLLGGWREEIVLYSADGERWRHIDSKYNETQLSPNESNTRSEKLTVPSVLGLDGPAYIKITAIPYNEYGNVSDSQLKYEATSQAINVGKKLYINQSWSEIDENSGYPQYVQLLRSGDIRKTDTYGIKLIEGDDRLVFPQKVDITAWNEYVYFELSVKDNDKIDDSGAFKLQISGAGYDPIELNFTMNDDENNTLDITPSVGEFTEGETLHYTITIPAVLPDDLMVYIAASDPKRFDCPEYVIIPAGERSVDFDLVAIDNNEIEIDDVFSLTFMAENYQPTVADIILHDNDMPELAMEVKPEFASEASGNDAFTLIISRSTNVDKQAVIRLSDNSASELYYSTTSVTLQPGTKQATISVGVKNNDKVDGKRKFTIIAAVYSSACGCTTSSTSVGYVTADVTVIDDDSPSLSLKSLSSMLSEGSKNNIVRVQRNTDYDKALTVTLSSDKDQMLSYPKTVTIPAQEVFVDVLVEVLSNDITDDDTLVTFTAQAEGYGPAALVVMITDQTLPDATIANFIIDGEEFDASSDASLMISVENLGNMPLPRNTPVHLYFDGRVFAKYYTPQDIEPASKVDIEKIVTLPAEIGRHTMYAVVNPDGTVREVKLTNNTSPQAQISIKPTFTADASVERKIYNQQETVKIFGRATGSKAANADIDVYVICDGSRTVIRGVTDAEGKYSVEYTLPGTLSGHFSVGACYPGDTTTEEMASFDVYGVALKSQFSTCELYLGETKTIEISVTNRGILPMTNVRLVSDGSSEECQYTFSNIETLSGGATATLSYTAVGTALSSGTNFTRLSAHFVSDEGLDQPFTLYHYVQSAHGLLTTETKAIDVTVNYYEGRNYDMTIRNIGKGTTGKISLSLPEWISTLTPTEMRALAPGDSTTIVLHLQPTSEMKPNETVSGYFGINCEEGDGLSIPYSVTFVSEKTGTLVIDAVDELTFRTAEAPHVAEADVVIYQPATQKIVAQGKTDASGICRFELTEGKYLVKVNEGHHDGSTFTTIVNPGRTTTEEAFLPYSVVTITWEVERTEIEDEYEMETVVKFDTRVPKPVVLIDFPDSRPNPYDVIPITITNKGLVAAFDVNIDLRVDSYDVEYLSPTSLDSIGALQSIVTYARLVPHETEAHRVPSLAACLVIKTILDYIDPCDKYKDKQYIELEKRWGECLRYYFKNTSDGGGGSSSPGKPNVWGGTNVGNSTNKAGDVPNLMCDGEPAKSVNGYDPNPLIPLGDFERIECEDELSIDLRYNLADPTGLHQRNGVATDGVSELKIVIDPSSKMINSTCGYTFKWTLSEDYGQLYGGTLEGVNYRAPADFPDDNKSEHIIYATIHIYVDNTEVYSASTPIDLVRVPVVMLHGLGDDASCWYNLYLKLRDSKRYESFMLTTYDYHETNTAHFYVNENVAYNRANYMFKRYIDRGYEVHKADFVGHSMGGILSRLCAQKVDKNVVHKIITANTPHSGSALGDFVAESWYAKIGARWFYGKDDINAVYDLALDSKAIDVYLNGPDMANIKGIPVHAVTTEVGTDILNQLVSQKCESVFSLSTKNLTWDVALYLIAKTLEDKDLTVGTQNDLVVSLESQRGGLADKNVSYVLGPFHCASPSDQRVIARVEELLAASVKSSDFTTDGFHPVDMTYKKDNQKKAPVKAPAEAVKIGVKADVSDGKLRVSAVDNSQIESYVIYTNFDGLKHDMSINNVLDTQIPAPFRKLGKAYIYYRDVNGAIGTDSIAFNVADASARPATISAQDVLVERGSSVEAKILCTYPDGTEYVLDPENVTFEKGLAHFADGRIVADAHGIDTATYHFEGMTCTGEVEIVDNYDFNDLAGGADDEDSGSICSTVTLSFKQKAYMVREAFRGTLTMENGHTDNPLQGVKLNLVVRDSKGQVMSKREFEIQSESINGFEGAVDLTSGWTLKPKATGIATILFIPTRYAAPTQPEEYSFGGSLSYIDPFSGLEVTRDLTPVTLTVNPTPVLDLSYFMQRDIYGDDPLTEDVEPSVPAEFALLINNKGYGDAVNLNITTNQPRIVSNDKGLALDFEIISSQINGSEATLALGGDIVTDFGTIPAGTQSYAQWWMQSSLLGHFTEYNLTVNHVTGFGNPDLSLIDEAKIFELIHGFDLYGSDGVCRRAFLVNEVPDQDDTPDHIYFTDATDDEVGMVVSASIEKESDSEYKLSVQAPASGGWAYGRIADPTVGRAKIVGIQRLSDGEILSPDNFWQTDRTLRDGKDPLQENVLHFVDNFAYDSESYTINFTPLPYVILAVESLSGVVSDVVLHEQVSEIIVTFNKDIDATTFTAEDIKLICQGEALDNTLIRISRVDDRTYTLDLSALTDRTGYYVLTVQTARITDTEGFNGERGKTIDWIQMDLNDGITDASNEDLKVSAHDMCIYVESPVETSLVVSNTAGQYRMIRVHPGLNAYPVPASGVYVVGGIAIMVK